MTDESYKLTLSDNVQRMSDKAFIPMTLDNGDYKEYLEWLIEGNEPLPSDPLPQRKPTLIERAIMFLLINTFPGNPDAIIVKDKLIAELDKIVKS